MSEPKEFLKNKILEILKNEPHSGKFKIGLKLRMALDEEYKSRSREFYPLTYKTLQEMVDDKTLYRYSDLNGSSKYYIREIE